MIIGTVVVLKSINWLKNSMNMKSRVVLLVVLLSVVTFSGCKLFGRAAAKYWTKQQISEFIANCEKNANRITDAESAKNYCDCAVDVVAEKYQNYEDVKKAALKDVLRVAKDCRNNN